MELHGTRPSSSRPGIHMGAVPSCQLQHIQINHRGTPWLLSSEVEAGQSKFGGGVCEVKCNAEYEARRGAVELYTGFPRFLAIWKVWQGLLTGSADSAGLAHLCRACLITTDTRY